MSNANHNPTPAGAELLEAAQRQALLVLGGIGADVPVEDRVKLLRAVQPVLDLSATKRTHVFHDHGIPAGGPGAAGDPPPASGPAGAELELE